MVEYLMTPVKFVNDTKEYRVIRLQNGLTAMLIADLHSKTCASQDDDEDKDDEDEDEDTSDNYDEENSSSLTKRVERNQKKILENDFDAFLSKRGGSTDTKTNCEQTTFFFDVQEEHLLPTLDRFAQFFIKPLMKRDAITRGRKAMESEFQRNLHWDDVRKNQLISSLARAGHPASKFTSGNLIRLRDNVDDDKLYAELHKFRERHYSAHRMKLAIQARLSLDTLQKYVTTCFADVPSNGLPPDDFTEFKGGISFDTPAFRRMYKIESVENLNQFTVRLTDEGQEHLEEVLDAIFSFINFWRMEGPQERIYHEMCDITEADFRVYEKKASDVMEWCESMHHYPPCDYIIGDTLYLEYDEKTIQMCLNYLKPENMNIMIINGKFNTELDKIEPWFQTRYTDVEIPREWLERWKVIKPLPDFHLPNTLFTRHTWHRINRL